MFKRVNDIKMDDFIYRIGHNSPSSGTETEFKSKRRSQISTSSSSVPADGSTHGSTPTPPPLPERTDSLNNRSEEAELRKAPWFQAGIPRLAFENNLSLRQYRNNIYSIWILDYLGLLVIFFFVIFISNIDTHVRIHVYTYLNRKKKVARKRIDDKIDWSSR